MHADYHDDVYATIYTLMVVCMHCQVKVCARGSTLVYCSSLWWHRHQYHEQEQDPLRIDGTNPHICASFLSNWVLAADLRQQQKTVTTLLTGKG